MENKETNQETNFADLFDVPTSNESNEGITLDEIYEKNPNIKPQNDTLPHHQASTGKSCKTCSKQKTLSKNNIIAVGISVGILFLTFYGLIQLCKDVVSLFTR